MAGVDIEYHTSLGIFDIFPDGLYQKSFADGKRLVEIAPLIQPFLVVKVFGCFHGKSAKVDAYIHIFKSFKPCTHIHQYLAAVGVIAYIYYKLCLADGLV